MSNQMHDLDFDSDSYMTTAVDGLTAALKSGLAGHLNVAELEKAHPDTMLGSTRGFDFKVRSEPVLEFPLSQVIVGYGSTESKERLANAVGWILHEETALIVSGLHEWSTFGDAARAIAGQLRAAPPAYRCTGPSKHVFRDWGTGLCTFDLSPLKRV